MQRPRPFWAPCRCCALCCHSLKCSMRDLATGVTLDLPLLTWTCLMISPAAVGAGVCAKCLAGRLCVHKRATATALSWRPLDGAFTPLATPGALAKEAERSWKTGKPCGCSWTPVRGGLEDQCLVARDQTGRPSYRSRAPAWSKHLVLLLSRCLVYFYFSVCAVTATFEPGRCRKSVRESGLPWTGSCHT